MLNLRMLKLSDMVLWMAVLAVILIGLLAIFSTTSSSEARVGGDIFIFIKRHLLSIFLGVIAMLFFTYTDYKRLQKFSVVIYAAMVLMLAAVLFLGFVSLGAQRWLSIFSISFQPSEISKLMLIIVLAAFLNNKKGRINSIRDLLPIMMIVGIPFALVFKQPDLGTSIVFIFISIG
ncbi:MAG: FtsW/RodA/SpoVE family cell cycle protein, partial [bacterium]